MISRRSFLADTSLALLAAGATLPNALAGGPAKPVPAKPADFARFEGCVNTRFAIRQNGEITHVVELAAAKRHPGRPLPAKMGGSLEEFSLSFTGAREQPALTQNTYTFEHPELGRFDIFIVPTREKTDGPRRYHAVFNRITNA
ncbi:MAG TPA: twin-arginine translocation signal domain-containing protein [Verrucomicrobiae bacterium]|nr:twin-arginine translocation signal domain-containing protein [Verrucomicrobiae bacterium]